MKPVTPPATKAGPVVKWIQDEPGKLLSLLPSKINPDRFLRIVVSEIARNESIQNCSPQSVFSAVSTAAKMGLEPGAPHNGDLVAYRDECVFVPGYKGLCSFLIGTGKVASVNAEVVRAKDVLRGSNVEGIVHEWAPAASREVRGRITAAYATIVYPDPNVPNDTVLMSLEQLEEVRAKSMSFQKGYGPWHGTETDREEMMKKTVIIRACKTLDWSVKDAEIIHEVVKSDSVLLDAEYTVHEVDEAQAQGSAAVADKLEKRQEEENLFMKDPDEEPAKPDPNDFDDTTHFKCKECHRVYSLSDPHGGPKRGQKTCGNCLGIGK